MQKETTEIIESTARLTGIEFTMANEGNGKLDVRFILARENVENRTIYK